MQALLEVMDHQFLGTTVEEYLIAAAVFLGVLVGLPIGKAIILRRLKAISERTANDFDDLLHDLLRRIVGPFVYLFAALYVGTLFLTLPESLDRVLQALFVIILTIKVAQVLQGITAYGIRKWTEQTAKEDPTSAAMLKNMTWVARFMIWAATFLFIFVESPAQRARPVPSSSRSARQARAHRGLVLLLCLSLMPAVASAQADVAEVPENAHVKRYGVGWECDWGYRTAAQSCEAITVPAHAHLDAFGGRWECDRGYRKVNEACASVEVPPHAFLNSSGHGWQCDRGYRRVAERCAEVVVPPHAFLNSRGDRWECERGFRRNGQSCVEFAVPRNAHIGYSENEWTCNPGYRQRGATCLPDER